jgi:hypothetical protein
MLIQCFREKQLDRWRKLLHGLQGDNQELRESPHQGILHFGAKLDASAHNFGAARLIRPEAMPARSGIKQHGGLSKH